jgi:hypothetical protein
MQGNPSRSILTFFTDLDIATVFARELGLDGAQAWDDVLLIEELLVRVRLPIEVLAIAFNILSKLVKQQNVDTLLQRLPLDALIISTLSLASIYTNDSPLSASHLARNVAAGPMTAMDIDMANISVMSALNWRIHDCTEGETIITALRMFERREPPHYVPDLVQEHYQEHYQEPCLKPEPLCLRLTDRHTSGEAHWDNGQLTPGASSSCSVAAEFEHTFLPLL